MPYLPDHPHAILHSRPKCLSPQDIAPATPPFPSPSFPSTLPKALSHSDYSQRPHAEPLPSSSSSSLPLLLMNVPTGERQEYAPSPLWNCHWHCPLCASTRTYVHMHAWQQLCSGSSSSSSSARSAAAGWLARQTRQTSQAGKDNLGKRLVRRLHSLTRSFVR